MTLKIAIVGASITGCACAIQLQRLGYDITVFEKSSALIDRGAGIMLPQDLIAKLIELKFIDADFRSIKVSERTVFTFDKEHDQQKILTTNPIFAAGVYWGGLYHSLHQTFKALNEKNCYYGAEVTQVKNFEDHVELTINNSTIEKFDYVFFADGYHSIGRQTLYPQLNPQFDHYMTWRGLVEITEEETQELLGYAYHQECYWYLYEKGHFLLYAIPKNNEPGKYYINWCMYENLETPHPLFIKDPTLAEKNVIPGKMSPEYINYLHQLAHDNLPPFPRGLVMKTPQPFTQAICDLSIPSYVVNRSCLLGDASDLLRPHVASGATKGLQNVLALGECLSKEKNMDTALASWNESQCKAAKQMYFLGEELGKLFVTNVPDLATLDKQKIDKLWQNVITKYQWYITKK